MTDRNFNLQHKNLISLCQCALFTALIAVGAFIKIPMPYFDYFTMQFFFVILSGMVLGAKWGTISVALYVGMGLAGLPIFAAGGGFSYVLRPSFGFLLAFIFTALAVGLICEKLANKTFRHYLLAALVGLIITYGIGLVYKYLILNYYTGDIVPMWLIFVSALPLDIPGDILSCVAAALIGSRLEKLKVGAINHVRTDTKIN